MPTGPTTDGSTVGSLAERLGTEITIYGCRRDEGAVFRELAPGLGVIPIIVGAPVSAANVGLAAGSRCISVDHRTPITGPTLAALGRVGVEYVSARSVGIDHIDVGAARGLGISVEAVTYSADSVADYTLMLMLMTLRAAKSTVLDAQVHNYRLNDERGRELRDLTVGVVGTGRIGTAVVTRLRGFGCRVLTHDTAPGGPGRPVPLDELLRVSDIVTLHTPLTSGTHHLLDARRIDQMRDGAIVVNTGRGALVDTWALLRALESGHLGGAALDVVEGEGDLFGVDGARERVEAHPLARLQRMANVLITPHTAYFTDHALRDIADNTLMNCLRFEGCAP